MNTILENVFLHNDVRGGRAIGFITAGCGAPAQAVGYIVRHDELGAVYVAYACHPTAFLSSFNLQTIVNRLKDLNLRHEND